MLEIVITSSVLILGILAVRKLFQQKIPAGIQYDLWLLVVVRLVLPLPEMLVQNVAKKDILSVSSPVSVMNVINYAKQKREMKNQSSPKKEFSFWEGNEWKETGEVVLSYEKEADVQVSEQNEDTVQRGISFTMQLQNLLSQEETWLAIWGIGIGFIMLWQGLVYIRFQRYLEKNRRKLIYQNQEVYLVKGINSPFLTWNKFFGYAIYLPEDISENSQLMEHGILHEMTHQKHGDLWWSLLRNVLTTVYWFHPLVWLASKAAAQDCELYCDAAVIQSMKSPEKKKYGESLLLLARKDYLGFNKSQFTTNMGNSKREIKKRIQWIAGGVSVKKWQMVLIGMMAVLLVGCTYTDGGKTKLQSDIEASQDKKSEASSDEFMKNVSINEKENAANEEMIIGSGMESEAYAKEEAKLFKEIEKKA